MTSSNSIVGAALLCSGDDRNPAFYESLFLWESSSNSHLPVRFVRSGNTEALLLQADAGATGWMPVVSVESSESLTTAVEARGGAVREIQSWCSMVVDPLGATFLAVTSAQVTATITPTLRPYDPNQSTPGALSWWQLNSTDPSRSLDFYTSVLGWASGESDNDKFTYWRFFNGQPLAHAGLMAVDERSGLDVPDGWQVYFHDDEVADAARRLVDLSGSVVVEPTEIVSGSFLVARDPAGHVFGVDRMTHGPVGGASR